MEIRAWRGAGAPVIGRYPAANRLAAERIAASDGAGLAARYADAITTEPDANTMAGIITAYKRSPQWTKLSVSTRRNWLRVLDRIRDVFGDLGTRAMASPKAKRLIPAWHDKFAETPREADLNIQVLSRLLNWAVKRGLIESNQAAGTTEKLWEADHSDEIWEREHLDKFHAAAKAAKAEGASQAVDFLRLTGLRVGDAASVTWGAVNATQIRWRTSKSQRKGKRQREVAIPITAELRALLERIPKRAATILTNSHGKPYASGVTMSERIQAIAKKAKIERRTHDLRGTAATHFYAEGFSDAQVAMIMGWAASKVERIRERYVAPARAITMAMALKAQ